MQSHILEKTVVELESELQRLGEAQYRARQIFQWLYVGAARSFGEMTNLPKELRARLDEHYRISILEIAERKIASDGTQKFLFRLMDGNHIEGVLMKEDEHTTLCVSTQVGCPLGCRFCATGASGYMRNLSAGEIVEQVVAAKRETSADEPVRNIVLMGMGEPLLNLANVVRAIRIMTSPQGLALSTRRITLSTVGIVPGMNKIADANLGINLAVSLNATTDEVRSSLIPIAGKYSIADRVEACRRFPLPRRRRITFEYVLLRGVNDSEEDAHRLAKILRGIPCKINVIPFNEVPHCDYRAPDAETVERFRNILAKHNYTASVRYSKGAEIAAACGQLAAHARRAPDENSAHTVKP